MPEPLLSQMQGDRASPADDDTPVLVAVLRHAADLARARDEHWYRIPVNAPARYIAADYLALYHTGAFPPDQRWSVHFYAPVLGYHIATRRQLIPQEPSHPRADTLYYRVDIGQLVPLPAPIPSRRLRRITFIHTTLDRLLHATEINDLWIKTPAQQRLWDLLKAAEVEAEIDFPLIEEADAGLVDQTDADPEVQADTTPRADLALFCHEGRIAVVLTGDGARGGLAEPPDLAYPLARGAWHGVTLSAQQVLQDAPSAVATVLALVAGLKGPLRQLVL